MSWLPNQRREQGTCKPPTKTAKVYRVRCGSPCFVRKVAGISNGVGSWFPYETTHTSTFENYEEQRGKRYVFREGDYEILISDSHVDIT